MLIEDKVVGKLSQVIFCSYRPDDKATLTGLMSIDDGYLFKRKVIRLYAEMSNLK